MILCKPDAVRRQLAGTILARIGEEIDIITQREVRVSETQIFTHYADMIALDDQFPFDVAAELRRNYVGSRVVVALGHGNHDGVPRRVRELLGHYDPSRAAADSIRGRFGADSLTHARAEGRFLDNLIHTSDDPEGVEREFRVWFGPAYLHLLASQNEQESRWQSPSSSPQISRSAPPPCA
ncbi:nucleoside-diphosphate kinase [Haloactinospora alba]|uniref:nucleoside-diphosphate kinase n=1 Tax=Haloactinospora alba TaxID=405555 RepID=UPI001FE644AC|nr:nucleoside-diphosphate kinase [Haloactinospora alba]